MALTTISPTSLMAPFLSALSRTHTGKGAEGVSPAFSWKEAAKTNVIVAFFLRLFGKGDAVDAKAKMGCVFEAAQGQDTSAGAKTDQLRDANMAVKWLESRVNAGENNPFRLTTVRSEEMLGDIAISLGLRDQSGDLTQAGMRMIVKQVLSCNIDGAELDEVPLLLSSIMEANQEALDVAFSEAGTREIQIISDIDAQDSIETIKELFKKDTDRNTLGDFVYTLGTLPLLGDDPVRAPWYTEKGERSSYAKDVYLTVAESFERASGGNPAILKTLMSLCTQRPLTTVSVPLSRHFGCYAGGGTKNGLVQVQLDAKGVATGGVIEYTHRAGPTSPINLISSKTFIELPSTTTAQFKGAVNFSIGQDGKLTFSDFTHSIEW